MKGTSDDWRWVDPKGAQSTTDKWDLVAHLSSGTIPYYTLVWRPGWAEWLPACRVEELAAAVGDHAEPVVAPRRDPTAKLPPPPPLFKYHAYELREIQAGRALTAPRAVSADELGPPSDGEGLGRRPMPTLAEEPIAPRGGVTLRPPAAVPPPPRAMPTGPPAAPRFTEDELDDEELEILSSRHLKPIPEAAARPPVPTPVPTPLPAPHATPLPEPVTGAGDALEGPATERRPRSEGPRAPVSAPPSSLPLLVVAGGVVVVATLVGIAVGVGLFVASGHSAGPAHPPSARVEGAAPSSGSATPGPARALRQCLLTRSGRRLYGAVESSVPPLLTTLTDGRVAVGFASNATTAMGLALDPDALTVKEALLEPGAERVAGVVPLPGAAPKFVVDRDGGPVAQARTIAPGLVVGTTEAGFARRTSEGAEVLWPGGGGEVMTAPRVATIPGVGHVVTFRRGDQAGPVLVGWLREDGSPKGAPQAIPGEGLAGTPAISANRAAVLVTFASRPDADAKWGVALAQAPHGAVPQRSIPFVVPPGGPGVETISPAATGLDDGRWVLQWTEGAAGNRQVRVQTLAPDLRPVGDAITLSAVEDNAGQGVVHAVGQRVISLFLVIRGSERQLWGATLTCE